MLMQQAHRSTKDDQHIQLAGRMHGESTRPERGSLIFVKANTVASSRFTSVVWQVLAGSHYCAALLIRSIGLLRDTTSAMGLEDVRDILFDRNDLVGQARRPLRRSPL